MPYQSTDAAIESSEYYGDYKQSELERKRRQILIDRTNYLDNPLFAETITRDDDGVLISFEDPLAFGKADEEAYELVTLEPKKRNFLSKYLPRISRDFSSF